jgi:hypothetical protein
VVGKALEPGDEVVAKTRRLVDVCLGIHLGPHRRQFAGVLGCADSHQVGAWRKARTQALSHTGESLCGRCQPSAERRVARSLRIGGLHAVIAQTIS